MRGAGQCRAGTDLGAALELLLGIGEHLNIQEEPESVVHGAEAVALTGWGQVVGRQSALAATAPSCLPSRASSLPQIPPRLVSPLLTGTEAPTVVISGDWCLRWGLISPDVVAVVRRVTDGASRLRGSWRLLSLPTLLAGGSRGQSQENHVIATTVWTYSGRFWKEGWAQSL